VRVVCCYTPDRLRRGTVESLRAQAPHAEFIDVSGSPDTYYEAFRALWLAADDDLLLVEHDIVLAPGTVAALETCPEAWCSCHIGSEERTTGLEAYFQCNRWRAWMMAVTPHVVDLLPVQRHWGTLDAYLLARMRGRRHVGLNGVPVTIPDAVRFEVHPHRDLATFHLSPSLGFSGDIPGIKAWHKEHSPPAPRGTGYEHGVDADLILAAYRRLQPTPPADGVEALAGLS
jgi:hypothetical protein